MISALQQRCAGRLIPSWPRPTAHCHFPLLLPLRRAAVAEFEIIKIREVRYVLSEAEVSHHAAPIRMSTTSTEPHSASERGHTPQTTGDDTTCGACTLQVRLYLIGAHTARLLRTCYRLFRNMIQPSVESDYRAAKTVPRWSIDRSYIIGHCTAKDPLTGATFFMNTSIG